MEPNTTDKPVSRGAANWARVQALIADGKCRDCRQPRGDGGTKDRCRGCANTWNRYQSQRKNPSAAPESTDPLTVTLPNGTRVTLTLGEAAGSTYPCKLIGTRPDGTAHRYRTQYHAYGEAPPTVRRLLAELARVVGHTQRYARLVGADAGDLATLDR